MIEARWSWAVVATVAVSLGGCDSEGDADAGPRTDAARAPDASAAPADGGAPADAGEATDDAGALTDAGELPACDFRAVDGIVVIEAESLPFTEDWSLGSDGEASGGEYIEWTGSSHNNDTSFGRFAVSILVEEAGLYQLQVRNRVGRGEDPTEHNDTWMRFPDAAAFYGIQGSPDAEDRVYPRPQCEDPDFLAGVEAMPNVTEASCPNGTSRDGYFKVYSSGALDWKWSARTSDNDAHDVVVRFDEPGLYTYQLAARGDFHRLDRIVLHRIELERSTVRDLSLAETSCP